jgi:hypothetical protein
LSQAEIAREIEQLFHTPYTQSEVSREVKRVDDWLQAIKANAPVRRAKRTIAADPSRNEPQPKVRCLAVASAWSEKSSTIATTDRANLHNTPA